MKLRTLMALSCWLAWVLPDNGRDGCEGTSLRGRNSRILQLFDAVLLVCRFQC